MTCSDKISIIIPAYNVEGELSRSLDSALAQTYSPIELIIVDDGSSDGTGAVAERYAEKHECIKVIHQENQGVFKARLNGIAQATGAWIGFLDADDEIEPEMYQVLMDNALSCGADISHCGYQMVFPSHVDYYYNTGRSIEQDHNTGLADLLEGNFIEPALGIKLYRKQLCLKLLSNPSLDTDIKINEDLLMNYYLFRESNRAVFLDKPYYHYVLRSNSASTSKINKHKLEDPLRVMDLLLQETAGIPDLHAIVLRRKAGLLVSDASMSVKQDPKLLKPFRSFARRQLKEQYAKLYPACKSSSRLRLILPVATYFPGLYGFIHAVYAKLRGYDKMYEVK